jgi:hypothetical protein
MSHCEGSQRLAKLYAIVAPNYTAAMESHQEAQDVIKQQKK